MGLPNVVTYNLAASNVTAIVNASNTVAAGVAFTLATSVVDVNQRRLLITATGNESSNTFTIVGTNQAGFPITESILGPNSSTVQTNLDFLTVTKITASANTAGTTSVGTDSTGSSLWNIMNWDVTPTDISVGCIVTSVSTAVNYTVEYTYDDPNNLPSGVYYPTPFALASLASQTGNVDSYLVNPVTGIRLTVNSGTGTVRMVVTQSGISGP